MYGQERCFGELRVLTGGLSSKPQSAPLWLHIHRLESEHLTETHKSLLLPGQPTSWFKAIQEREMEFLEREKRRRNLGTRVEGDANKTPKKSDIRHRTKVTDRMWINRIRASWGQTWAKGQAFIIKIISVLFMWASGPNKKCLSTQPFKSCA